MSLANKGQAELALEKGKQYLVANNPVKALRLFTKSKTLYALPDINNWLQKAAQAVRKQQQQQQRKSTSSHSSSSSSRPSGSGSSRQSASSARNGVPRMRRAQSAPNPTSAKPTDPVVIEVLSKRTGHYYDILGISNTSSEKEIKKAYRKLALKLHPDRNTTPGAADAFKRIGEAYNTLSDTEKKRDFDRWGPPEEENQADGQQQQSRRGGRHHYYEQEIDPNDIFNAFFGGGFPRAHVYRSDVRGQHQETNQAEPLNQLMRLLPLLLLFLFTFLQLPSSQPKIFALDQTTRFYKPVFTQAAYIKPKIKYYVSKDFSKNDYDMNQLESNVERSYLERLANYCRQERQQQRYDAYHAQVHRDRELQRQIRSRRLRYCNEYSKRAEGIQRRRL
jgi:curved DNA-binding protein CbpA